MDYKKILTALELIEGELDDATNQLPDARTSIDGAKYELYTLKDDIERAVLDEKKDYNTLYNIPE